MEKSIPRQFDLPRLHSAFDHRAARFVANDFVPREVMQRLQEHLAPIKLTPRRILDVGCATGNAFSPLQKIYPCAHIIGLDWSAAMLTYAQATQGGILARLKRALAHKQRCQIVQADWSSLPIANRTIDLLWSNLALHWSSAPHQTLSEWARVLDTNGLLIFSTLGPDSLKELRHAFTAVDAVPHIPDFVDMHDLGDMLVHSGLANPVMESEYLTLTYTTPQALLTDVRSLGIYPGSDAKKGLHGRTWHHRLLAAIESQRNKEGCIALTLELVYGHAWQLTCVTEKQSTPQLAYIQANQIQRAGSTKK